MEYFTPLQNLLKNSALHPNKVFLHQPVNRQWLEFTWADVEHQARCIAAGLKNQGYDEGTKIGILSKNCAQWLIADLAIMMAGMISVPIYATAERDTIEYIIKHADIKAIFIGKLDNTDEAEAAIDENILCIAFPYPTAMGTVQFSEWLTATPPLANIHQPDIEETATIVYTSGSTGLPKGVILTYKNLACVAQCLVKKFNLTDNFRSISYLPLAHIVERSNEYVGIYVGLEIFFVESLDTFKDDLQYACPTGFVSVPRLWTIFQTNILAKMPQKKLALLLAIPILGSLVAKKIRTALGLHQSQWFMSGSAPIALPLLDWYEKLDIPISEGWGMTETSGASCLNYPCSKESKGTIGKPLPCVEMKLSAEGEILIRGDAVFSEYYLDPQTTQNSFVDGWFRTGDCAEVNKEGNYKIIGRIKDKFKTSKGKYVAPVPIESLLSSNLDIEQVCVMGAGIKQPVALIVLTSTVNKRDDEVINRLKLTLKIVNNKLESHQQLDYLIICTEIWSIENKLLTPSMKIKRNIIEDKYSDLISSPLLQDVRCEEDIS
jgi:long-subunit acyl-CoA synthetase (AMP-forming)